jgi:predicted AAA+ superfamily ATPase
MVNGDQIKYSDVLSGRDLKKLKGLVDGYDLLFIDEAQRIADIGINLKILKDEIPDLKILVTGSSSLSIAGKVSEPLTGRKLTYNLYPVSVQELTIQYNEFEINDQLEELMIFGSYPEIKTTTNFAEKVRLLQEITGSYLYKDVLELSYLKNPHKITDLLKALALQIGSEVSIHEISKLLGLNRETVERYIHLLEESFVIFRIKAFSRNLRKEISKMDKIYFYDLGIRNTLIDNHNPIDKRNDIGMLWENFILAERLKFVKYNNINVSRYYWRTYTGAEIDYVEESGEILQAYEIKYKNAKAKPPRTWSETYKKSEFHIINRDNYIEYFK